MNPGNDAPQALDGAASSAFDAWMGYPSIPVAMRDAFEEAFVRGWDAAINAADSQGASSAVCSICNWTNVSLLNLGDPDSPRWVCHGCCKRSVEKADATASSQDALVRRWRSDADAYRRQVDEARSKGLTHDQMLAMMTCLRSCAKDLETALAKQSPNAAGPTAPKEKP